MLQPCSGQDLPHLTLEHYVILGKIKIEQLESGQEAQTEDFSQNKAGMKNRIKSEREGIHKSKAVHRVLETNNSDSPYL